MTVFHHSSRFGTGNNPTQPIVVDNEVSSTTSHHRIVKPMREDTGTGAAFQAILQKPLEHASNRQVHSDYEIILLDFHSGGIDSGAPHLFNGNINHSKSYSISAANLLCFQVVLSSSSSAVSNCLKPSYVYL